MEIRLPPDPPWIRRIGGVMDFDLPTITVESSQTFPDGEVVPHAPMVGITGYLENLLEPAQARALAIALMEAAAHAEHLRQIAREVGP